MHIRPLTRRSPAKAADIAYFFDLVAQLLNIIITIQNMLDKE